MHLDAKIRQRFSSIHSGWRTYLRAVVYVPASSQPILYRVTGKGSEALRSELERLAALAASWATALMYFVSATRASFSAQVFVFIQS
jgi:hypothetical protein